MRARTALGLFAAAVCYVPAVTGEKVAIIGAGISGLSAAYNLLTRHGFRGEDVTILEREPRVGGRTFNQHIPGSAGEIVELGGTWVGPTQDEVLALVDELGLTKFETWTKNVNDTKPSKAQRMLDKWAQEVPLGSPWQYAHAAELDAISVAQWEKSNGTECPGFGDTGLTKEVSMLYYLWWIHSCGSLELDASMTDGAQKWRIQGGSQLISLRLHDWLRSHGVTIRLNTSVFTVSRQNGSVTITASDTTVEAQRLIVALGTVDRHRIAFDPPLPAAHQEWMKAWTRGGSMKSFLYWDQGPFWRKSAWISPAFSLIGLPFFDYSPPGAAPRPGVLATFGLSEIINDTGSAGKTERADYMFGAVKRANGSGVGAFSPKPTGYIEYSWDERSGFSNCVGGPRPGALTRFGAEGWRTPVDGTVFWAGADSTGEPTKSGTSWTGYMDGAVRSGQRTAAEVATSLRR
eukprot:TRINITY_DN55176_c0_g1_i1.p1 TRINITY_DN55176_c0_g1~~TRINITY_DN55176_c0_g1_i1.p1  ORF type:complete len:493 (+),score=131.71 TRINITY_DN55176_c0_g1_i1:98-1480(+)